MLPKVLQSGSLSESTFIDLVAETRAAADEAILEVARPSGSRSFFFRDGKLVALVTSSKPESFSAMLVRRRKLQRSVAESIDTVAATDGLTPAQVMLRDRLLPIPELVKELNLWATLLVVETFGWDDADYRIVPFTRENSPPETLLEINLPAALLKGVFRRMSIEDVRLLLRPFHENRPRHATPLPYAPVVFDLDAHQQGFWESLDGTRRVAEILSITALPPDDAARLLLALHRTGMVDMGERAEPVRSPEPNSGGFSLDDLFDDPDLDLDTPAPTPGFDPRGPAVRAPSQAPSPPPAPEPVSAPSGVDMSAIRFRRGARSDGASATFHSVTSASRESFNSTTSGVFQVGVVTGRAETVEEVVDAAAGASLSGLFDGLDLGAAPASEQPSARVAPPRGGRRSADWRAASAPGSPPPSSAPEPKAAAAADPDAPPDCGPTIEAEDWARLTTRDKERIRGLCRELARMESTNYFEWFGLSHDSPVGSIKKAYFQMAKLYHPDSLIDEPEAYRGVAEELFAAFSTAYETLSDEEARDAYVRKRIFGEKDENELALEKVQLILAAENSFKTGLRFLNNGQLKEALRHFKAAVQGYDEEAEYVAYYGYALFRARLGSDPTGAEEGIDLIKKAAAMREAAPKPYHLLGKAYLAKGEPLSAKRHLRRSLKLLPDNPEALRDYRKADELSRGVGGKKDDKKSEKKGLFGGVFGRKKKDAKKEEEDLFEGMDLDL